MRELEARAEFRFEATRSSGPVSALLLRPAAARWLLVLAHGAGAAERNWVRLLPGDRVEVEFAEHDPTRGRIVKKIGQGI